MDEINHGGLDLGEELAPLLALSLELLLKSEVLVLQFLEGLQVE